MQQPIRSNTVLMVASFLLGISIILGALAAHALKNTIEPNLFNTFQVGVHYHQLQSMGLLLIGLFIYFKPKSIQKLKWPLILHFTGLFFFSGNCYIYALTQVKFFVHLVPMGGLMMIAAWFWTALCWNDNQ